MLFVGLTPSGRHFTWGLRRSAAHVDAGKLQVVNVVTLVIVTARGGFRYVRLIEVHGMGTFRAFGRDLPRGEIKTEQDFPPEKYANYPCLLDAIESCSVVACGGSGASRPWDWNAMITPSTPRAVVKRVG